MRRGFVLLILATLAACGGDQGASMQWVPLHTSSHWWMSATPGDDGDHWVVGGTTTVGSILRIVGGHVSEVDHGIDVGLLNWIHRFDDGGFVVVGNGGAVLRSPRGVAWKADQPPTDRDLWGVWGASPNDVWAVGGDPAGGQPVLLRDTGAGFEPVTLPPLQRPGVHVLFKVWGSGPEDVYFVGQRGVVLHWDGRVLEELLVGIGQDLIAVWGTGPDRVAVVGGRSNAQAALWNGTEWRTVDAGRYSGLNGVWFDDEVVHVVGNDGVTGTIHFPTATLTVGIVDTPVALHAITGTASSLLAVGGDFATGPGGPFLGQVFTAPRG